MHLQISSSLSYRKQDGFTLVELLVVVAMIGVLASIVLVSLGDGRKRTDDAAIKANLQSIRNSAELFASNNNSFLPSGGSTFALAACPVYNASGTNMMSKDKVIADAVAQATSRGGNGNRCYNSSTKWAVAVGYKTSATKSWCVDSEGNSKEVNSAVASAINGTTFVCN